MFDVIIIFVEIIFSAAVITATKKIIFKPLYKEWLRYQAYKRRRFKLTHHIS